MAKSPPINLLGHVVSGDIGGYSIYTDRFGRKVIYPKAPPKEPPSDAQIRIRDRFKSAQQEYMALSDSEKLNWEIIVQRTSLCMTGQNLYIHIAMKGSYGLLDTLMQQTALTVTPPTRV